MMDVYKKINVFLMLSLCFSTCAMGSANAIYEAYRTIIEEVSKELTPAEKGLVSRSEGIQLPTTTNNFHERAVELPHQTNTKMHPMVRITSGRVIGETVAEAHAFYSIPFAKPPVGPLRYMPPEPADTFAEPFNASLPNGRMCYQIKDGCGSEACHPEMSEDCLVLNIHVPTRINLSDPDKPPQDRLPVLVWFYGGFFFLGRATSPKLDGRWLSQATDSIIITVNYRVGPLGFLSFEENGMLIEGNQGFKDQQLALQWVKNNVEAFGGDSQKVTIFGNSAGSQAIIFHFLSSISKPLFQRGIVESSPTVFGYQTPLESTATITARLLGVVGCANNASCLRTLSAITLTEARNEVILESLKDQDIWGTVEPFRPVIDGNEFTDQPLNLFQAGSWNTDKDIIIGTNNEEMAYISATIEQTSFKLPKRVFVALNTFVLGDESGNRMADLYSEGVTGIRPDYSLPFAQEITDMFFVCPNRALARFASYTTTNSKRHVYLYNNAYAQDITNCKNSSSYPPVCGTAYHSSEQIFVFKSPEGYGTYFTEEDSFVSDMFSTYWGSFAATGDPTSGLTTSLGQFTSWPIYSPNSEEPWTNILLKYPQSEVQIDYRRSYCDVWDDIGFYVNITDHHSTTTSDATSAYPIPTDRHSTTTSDAASAYPIPTDLPSQEETTTTGAALSIQAWSGNCITICALLVTFQLIWTDKIFSSA